MKQIETTKSGKNYKVINVGKFSDLMDYELPLGPDFTLHGKVFAGQAVGARRSFLVRTAVSCTPTRLTRNFTLF